jgi:RNA polymerase sigma factor (sigma-70 family)
VSGGGRFADTRWTLVLTARDAPSPAADEALAELCRQYWRPLHAFTCAQGYSADDAADLTQAFFERLIAKRDLANVDRSRGRFRSFLLASLKHFLANARDHDRAVKRGARHVHIPLEDLAGERTGDLVADGITPETLFEEEWLAAVLERVIARLRSETDAERFPLVEFLAAPLFRGDPEAPLRTLAEQLSMSEGAIRVALHRMRRRLRHLLEEEVAATVADRSDVEAEIRYLFAVAARRSGPRL